jgi:hypothetical protein
MKKIIGSLTLSLFVLQAAADVFIAPSNAVVFLSVPTNQTLLISSIRLGTFDEGLGGGIVSLAGLVVLNGVTNTVQFSDPGGSGSISGGPCALNGPCQIAFVEGYEPYPPAAVVVSYNLLSNSLLHSLIVTPGSTNVILVPAGKSIRFLKPTYSCEAGSSSFGCVFQNGTNTIYNLHFDNGDEFTGPLKITRTYPDSCYYSQLISYYFTDDFFVVPDTGYIRGPTGSFEIAVEKSVDLTAWCPVVVYNTGSDQKAFYRLRIQK